LFAATVPLSASTVSARGFEAQVDVYATLTSDCSFRGISQTQGKPALQAGIDVELPSAMFAGLWGSPMEFASGERRQRRRDPESDLYVGVSGDLGPDWSWTTSLVHYHYPDTSADYDHPKLNGGLYFRDSFSRAISYSAEAAGIGFSYDFLHRWMD